MTVLVLLGRGCKWERRSPVVASVYDAAVPPPKRKPGARPDTGGGRVTPKGTRPGDVPRAGVPTPRVGSGARSASASHAQEASSRYTPPIPRDVRVSPTWVPVLMFTLLAAGALMIVLNYLELLPSSTSNYYLLGGLALILGGIVTATQYH